MTYLNENLSLRQVNKLSKEIRPSMTGILAHHKHFVDFKSEASKMKW